MLELRGPRINLYIEQGPLLGPVPQVFVADVAATRSRLIASGCEVVKDEPEHPAAYLRDPFGLIYNLAPSAV